MDGAGGVADRGRRRGGQGPEERRTEVGGEAAGVVGEAAGVGGEAAGFGREAAGVVGEAVGVRGEVVRGWRKGKAGSPKGPGRGRGSDRARAE